MHRVRWARLFLGLALVGGVSTAAVADDWYEHLRAARAALARDDFVAARPELERVDSIVGGHPGAMFALASIAAHGRDGATAIAWLRDYAATGLARRLANDTTFDALAADPEFVAVVARLDSNATPLAAATVAVRLNDAGLLAEDVAWDAARHRFLVSSIHRRKIVAVTMKGAATDFVAPGADGVWGMYALALDAGRGRLWATTAAGPVSEGYEAADSGRTALLAYDLRTARRRARIELPRDGAKHVLGDLALAKDGTVYVTESVGGGAYRLHPGAMTLDTLAPSGTFHSPQTPVLAMDGKRLLIPDYPRGLAALDLSSGQVTWLAKPRTLAAGGIDGLYRADHRLIAIQNGTSPHRVLELTLDAGETRVIGWRVLERASEWLGEPNHGTWVGRDFFFLGNSGWDRVNDAEELEISAAARPPVLLELPGLGAR